MTHLSFINETVIIVGFFIMTIYVMFCFAIMDILQKKLDYYRRKYGFDKEIESSTMKTKNPAKIEKRLAYLEKRFNARENAIAPKQQNETFFQYVRRKLCG